jgi:hypothetical protein
MSKINSHFQLLVYVNVRVVCNGSWNIETRIETQKATQGLGQILYGIGSLRNSSSFFATFPKKKENKELVRVTVGQGDQIGLIFDQ